MPLSLVFYHVIEDTDGFRLSCLSAADKASRHGFCSDLSELSDNRQRIVFWLDDTLRIEDVQCALTLFVKLDFVHIIRFFDGAKLAKNIRIMRTPSSEHPTGPGGGWVKLHRKLLEWEWYQDAHMVHLLVHLLLTASHEDKEYKGLTIKRGQLATTTKELAETLGTSRTSIWRRLKRLEVERFVKLEVKQKETVITICKYDSYQESKKKSETRGETKVKQSYNNRNNKKGRRSNEDNTSLLSPSSPPPRVREVFSEFSEVENNRYRVELANDGDFIQYAKDSLRINERTVLTLLGIFASEVNEKKKPHTSASDYRQHFYDWARIHVAMNKKNQQKSIAHARHSDLSAALEADRAKYSRKS